REDSVPSRPGMRHPHPGVCLSLNPAFERLDIPAGRWYRATDCFVGLQVEVEPPAVGLERHGAGMTGNLTDLGANGLVIENFHPGSGGRILENAAGKCRAERTLSKCSHCPPSEVSDPCGIIMESSRVGSGACHMPGMPNVRQVTGSHLKGCLSERLWG